MKHILLILMSLIFSVSVFATDSEKENPPIGENINTEYNQDSSSPGKTPIPPDEEEPDAPGKFSSFWFTFLLAAIGTATLWGAALGPIAVLIVYFTSGTKAEVRKSLWGWLAGLAVGIVILILRFAVLA